VSQSAELLDKHAFIFKIWQKRVNLLKKLQHVGFIEYFMKKYFHKEFFMCFNETNEK